MCICAAEQSIFILPSTQSVSSTEMGTAASRGVRKQHRVTSWIEEPTPPYPKDDLGNSSGSFPQVCATDIERVQTWGNPCWDQDFAAASADISTPLHPHPALPHSFHFQSSRRHLTGLCLAPLQPTGKCCRHASWPVCNTECQRP